MIVPVDDIYIAHRLAIPFLQHTDLVSVQEACMKARFALAVARDEVFAQLSRLIAVDDRSSLRPGLPVNDLMRLLESGLVHNRLIAYSGSSALIAYKLTTVIHPCPLGPATAWHSSSPKDLISALFAQHLENLKRLSAKANGDSSPLAAQHLYDEITDALGLLAACAKIGIADRNSLQVLELLTSALRDFTRRRFKDLTAKVADATTGLPILITAMKDLLASIRNLQTIGLPNSVCESILGEVPSAFDALLMRFGDDLKSNKTRMTGGAYSEDKLAASARDVMALVRDSFSLGVDPYAKGYRHCVDVASGCAQALYKRSQDRFKALLEQVVNKTMLSSDPRLKSAAAELVKRKQSVVGLGIQVFDGQGLDDVARLIASGVPATGPQIPRPT